MATATISFGSFGDIVQCLDLVVKVIECFHQTGHATPLWVAQTSFLRGLSFTLVRLDKLSKSTPDKTFAVQLHHLSGSIGAPLTQFKNIVEKYKPALEEGSTVSKARKVMARIEFTLRESIIPKINGLRTEIDQHLQNINSLILLYTM